MKALILAAGLGTRLLPHTRHIPKPLFPIAGRPLLEITILNLIKAGCREILINTHHLSHKIEDFLSAHPYPAQVVTRYEPEILGTGGAIKNFEDVWDDQPFMVINSDIVTNIDLSAVYRFHLDHGHPVTLVLHDYAAFNKVLVRQDDFIIGFDDRKMGADGVRKLAFTGIQVADRRVLEFIPGRSFYSSIDAYGKMIDAGMKIKAFVSKNHCWQDIGTPQVYSNLSYEKTAPKAFSRAFPEHFAAGNSDDFSFLSLIRTKLKGDGSDRCWYRLSSGQYSVVMADHGIQSQSAIAEIDSFVSIGRHLYNKGIPVPRIYDVDRFSGLVYLEDLGDTNLQEVIQNTNNPEVRLSFYKTLVEHLVTLSFKGKEGFDPSWTYQSPTYSRALILERECRYFVEAFLNKYLGMGESFEDYAPEFMTLADNALSHGVNGFMHRDMQSRNIMLKNDACYFIDFQGGRLGPLQYDLASLLIDPYVRLPLGLQEQLTEYCYEQALSWRRIEKKTFNAGYRYCTITRNLQMLGAFGYLSRVKGKTYFETYIPAALATLKMNLGLLGREFPKLSRLVENLYLLPTSSSGCERKT